MFKGLQATASQVLFYAAGGLSSWKWTFELASNATITLVDEGHEALFYVGPELSSGAHAHVVAQGVQASVSAAQYAFDVDHTFTGRVGYRYPGFPQPPTTDEIKVTGPIGSLTCLCRAPDLALGDWTAGQYTIDWNGATASYGQITLLAGVDVPGLIRMPGN